MVSVYAFYSHDPRSNPAEARVMDILSLAVVMPQLAEWSPPTSQVCGSKLEHLLPVDETKMNNKRP